MDCFPSNKPTTHQITRVIMATYRVNIRRPGTPSSEWDTTQTVIAQNKDIALGRAYADWQRTHSNGPIPPLSRCETEVAPAGQVMLSEAASISPAQQAYIDDLKEQVTKLLAPKLDGKFDSVIYPAGFNYGITYGNNAYYNVATLTDIDTLLGMNSNGMLGLTGGGFSNLYAQFMQSVVFDFSQADLKTMNAQDQAAEAQIAAVLRAFEDAGGTYSNPLPPIGGKLQDVFDQLTKQFGSLRNLPTSLNALRNAIAAYESVAATSYALHNRYYAATDRIKAAVENTMRPSATNGGQQVSNTAYYVGFTPSKLPTVNQLIGSLNAADSSVKVSLQISDFTQSSSHLKISGGGGFSFPIATLFSVSIGASASYDLSKYTSSASTVTMDLEYPGVTTVGTAPTRLATDNVTGWYADDILQEVVEKTGKDATGYQLVGSEFNVNELFGEGKAFSRLKTFVISQQPTITMTFNNADTRIIESDFNVGASLKVKLLGLFTMGSASGSYTVQDVSADSKQGSVTIKMGPPAASGTVPLAQEVAYVLGGVASYPPDNV